MSIHELYGRQAELLERKEADRAFLMGVVLSLKNGSTTLDEIEVVGPNGEGGIKIVPKPKEEPETPTE